MLRLVHPAPQGKVSARPKGRKSPALFPSHEERLRIHAAIRNLNEMQRANLRALLRQLRCQHSWIVIARLLSFRRSYLVKFAECDEPGSMALARGIAAASELDLNVALDGHFIVTAKGVKPLRRS